MSGVYSLVLSKDRIGVLIGRGGSVKRRLEELLRVRIGVDSATGRVSIENVGEDVDALMKASNIIRAIEYGFSPERAERLLSDDYSLHVMDLTSYGGKSDKDVSRIKGRIIGEGGKTRRVIEETTGVDLSVYRNFVGMIGSYEGIVLASEAVKMLASGSPHKSVYNYLFTQRRRKKMERMDLWE
ncbi:MAG: pre-rRNA-processing protein PNO1 [Candidatus Geothermarchaeales archaeon]